MLYTIFTNNSLCFYRQAYINILAALRSFKSSINHPGRQNANRLPATLNTAKTDQLMEWIFLSGILLSFSALTFSFWTHSVLEPSKWLRGSFLNQSSCLSLISCIVSDILTLHMLTECHSWCCSAVFYFAFISTRVTHRTNKKNSPEKLLLCGRQAEISSAILDHTAFTLHSVHCEGGSFVNLKRKVMIDSSEYRQGSTSYWKKITSCR